MITWFQRVFGKHLQWVLVLMLVILLLSCIVGIGAVPRLSQNGQTSASSRLFLGVDLNDERQMQPIKDAVIYTLGTFYRRNENITQQEYQAAVSQRIALMYYADQWHLPPASAKDIDTYIRNGGLPMFTKADGSYDAEAFTKYHDELQVNPQRDTILGIIAANARLDRVRSILGGPGYIIPSLPNLALSAGRTKFDFDLVTLNFKTFVPKVDVSDAALQQLYDKDPKQFQRPAQISISYAKFAPAAVPDPTPEQLSAYVKDHAADFPELKPDNLGDKKSAVTEAWRKTQETAAAQQAYKQGLSFARELDALDAPRNSPEVDKLVKKDNLSLQQLPIITAGKPIPADSPVPEATLQEAYQDGFPQKAFFSAPLRLPDGSAVVLLLDALTQPAPRTFAEAHDDLATLYTTQEKTRQFNAYGEVIRANLIKELAAGKTFAEAAAAYGLTAKSFTGVNDDSLETATSDAMDDLISSAADQAAKKAKPTVLADLGMDLLKALSQPTNDGLSLLQTLRPGEVSSVIAVPDQGVIFHVSKRTFPSTMEDTPEVEHLRKEMNLNESGFNAGAVWGPLVQANAPKDNG